MKFILVITLIGLLWSVRSESCNPREIKLQIGQYYSYKNTNVTARVSFQTYGQCNNSYIVVKYSNNTNQTFNKVDSIHQLWTGQEFCMNGCEDVYYDQYTHIVDLAIPTGISFEYVVISKNAAGIQYMSQNYQSILPNFHQQQNEPREYLFFGDFDQSELGNYTWDMLEKIYSDKTWNISHFISLGDYAYEFWQQNGTKGDNFLQRLSKYVTRWPYTITAGNHEEQYNFTFFNEKFNMIDFDKYQNFYYSYKIGLVHFIQFNVQYFSKSSQSIKKTMIDWLENDLIEANKDRNYRPWIVAFSHYPIYCNDTDSDDFYYNAQEVDEIFYRYNVDLLLSGHKHSFNFMQPIYKNQVKGYEQQSNQTFINPKSYIQIIQGNGGNREMQSELSKKSGYHQPSAESSSLPGLGRMIVLNSTTIILQAFESLNQTQISNFTLVSNHNYSSQENTIYE